MTDIVSKLKARAESYRLGGPSSEHTAELLELAAMEIEYLRFVCIPFARVSANDIGDSETNEDFFAPMKEHNRAPRLTVGDFRRLQAAALPLPAEA